MTQPIGEEFIRIRPSLEGFRAELESKLAASLAGIAPQLQAAQSRLAASAASSATLAGLPAATRQIEAAQASLTATTARSTAARDGATAAARRASEANRELSRTIKNVETDTGRAARGLVAATAASTGFFRAVSFASGAFLVGAAIGAAIGTATQEFTEATRVAAQTAAVLRATGESANVTAGDVARLADQQLRLTGIDDELIKQSENVLLTFKAIRNETGAMNNIFDRATVAVEDISSVLGTSMTSTAIQVGKALQDPIRGVTALRRSGINLSQSQRELIKRMAETGRVLSAQKVILGEIESQVGGTARAVGQTLPGKLAILREESKNALADFVERVSESQAATEAFGDSFGGLQDAVRSATRTLTPFLEGLAATVKFAADLGILRPLAKTLTTLALAFTAVRLATQAATAAKNAYIRATTIEIAVLNAETKKMETQAVRIGATAGLLRSLAGSFGIAVGVTAAALAFDQLRKAADRAPGSLNATKRALDGLNSAVKESNRLTTDAAGARENVSIERFNVRAARLARDRAEAAIARSSAPRGSLQQEHLEFAAARARDALTKATDALTAAERKRDELLERQRILEEERPALIRKTTEAFREQLDATRRQSRFPTLFGQPVGIRLFQREFTPGKQIENAIALSEKLAEDARKAGDTVNESIGGSFATLITRLDRLPNDKEFKFIVTLAGAGASTNTIIRRLLGIEPSTEQIRLRGFRILTPDASQEERFKAAKAALAEQEAILRTIRNTEGATAAELRKAGITRAQGLKQAREELKVKLQTVAADRESVRNARESLRTAIQSLSDARRSYRDAVDTLRQTIVDTHKAIADAVTESRRSVTQAVASAKDNLQSLGQALAGTLDEFQQAGSRTAPGIAREVARLRAEVRAGAGGPETTRARQKLQFLLTPQATPKTEELQRKFDDLSFDLSTGSIKSMREFNKRLRAIVGDLDPQKLKATLGSAAAGSFLANLNAFREQAAAILAGPQRRGGPGQPQVIDPATALRQGAASIAQARRDAGKDIASAVRAVGDARRGITEAERDVKDAHRDLARALDKLRRDQVDATKAQTAATKANTRAANQLKRVLEARGGLLTPPNKNKPKPENDVTREHTKVPISP